MPKSFAPVKGANLKIVIGLYVVVCPPCYAARDADKLRFYGLSMPEGHLAKRTHFLFVAFVFFVAKTHPHPRHSSALLQYVGGGCRWGYAA